MNTLKILSVSILISFCSLSYAQNGPDKIKVSESAKAVLMKNQNLKSKIFAYLDYFSCDDEKKQDFIGLYSLFSKKYLNRAFPNIKSADEYKEHMLDRSEIYYIVYQSIESVELSDEVEARVKVVFDYGNEGQIDRMEEVLFFELEDSNWKYYASGSSKFIEVIEPF